MRKTLLISAVLLAASAAFAQPKLTPNNIDEVLAAMTLQEKAQLLVGAGWGSVTAGSMTASSIVLVPGAAGTTRGIDRLGIPPTVLADGPAGIRISPKREGSDKTYYATGFPVGTVMASTWNLPLVQQLTSAMGEEYLEYGVDVALAPGMNLHRNPLCGRNFEYFSEDPLLTGKVAAAYVNGMQSRGVGVSSKHFVANDAETNRQESDSRMNQRTLREITLKGFEIMVKESDPWTIMSSYNKLNGKYTQQNYELLTTILRDEWGFRGIVITDWGSKDNTVEAVKAGNDLMEPGMDFEIERIVKAVEDGSLPIADVDRNVRYMLEYIVKTPRFKGYKYSDKPDLASHAGLVREAAAEGLVLLKNDAALPFCKDTKNVALFGTTSYDMIAGGTGSGNVNKAYIRNLSDGLRENGLTVDPTIEDWYTKYIAFKKADNAVSAARISMLLGDAVLSEPATPKKLISSSVKDNDIAVITIGRNAGEGADRKITNGDWTLTAEERELLQNVTDEYHAAGKKVVVVLNIGGVIETASWKDLPDAILLAWTPGQEVGYTVADVLKGKSYPSGKLPMTFPVNYFDIPSSFNFPYEVSSGSGFDFSSFFSGRKKEPKKDIDYINYEEGIWVGYRYFTTAKKEVSYPFGYGLSYTSFQYGKPSVKVDKDGNISASVTITNTGKRTGKEIVELYVTAPENGLVKPLYELRSFAKTRELAPGESQTLTMKVDAYTLASFKEADSCWETAAGKYTAHFGASANDLRCNAPFSIKKTRSWKVNNVLAPESPVQEISVTR